MPQRERLRVWRGDLRKTAGGLTKKDLMRNARGKIVSRKKSSGATNENNLGKWLRSAGDSFGGKLEDAGLPPPKPKGRNKKPVKAPKPQVDRKIKKPAAPKPKKVAPKPKPKQPKQQPKPKPKQQPKKAEPKKKFAKPAALKPRSPVKAGQIKNYQKISVGNIVVEKKVDTTGWQPWAKKQTNTDWIEKKVKKEGGVAEMDDEDWDDLKDDYKRMFRKKFQT
jgi:hypothetical protein